MRPALLVILTTIVSTAAFSAQPIPRAVVADPPPDSKFPARMEVIHVPTGGVEINGVAYVASGSAPHPAFVLFHGLPGNEKNLDLAQAVRRAGWTVVTVNYRGSWGSPGKFSFAQNLEDARATLAYIRAPEHARRLAIDVNRIAIGGHSMGGWVAAETLAQDSQLLGGVTISAGDIGALGERALRQRDRVVALMSDNHESLAGITSESMTDEIAAHAKQWSFAELGPQLVHRRLLVLYSNDFVKSDSVALIDAVKRAGGKSITSNYVNTDHSWSGQRITLESLVIDWLQTPPAHP